MQIIRPFGLAEPPTQWDHLPHGNRMKQDIQQHLDEWLPHLLGDNLLSVGLMSAAIKTDSSPIKNKFTLNRKNAQTVDLVSKSHAIPVDSLSMDLVIAAFTLDFTHKPHSTLRELHRLLNGEGHLVLINFNPWSFWGLGKLLCGVSGVVPWNAHFYRPGRIMDWLTLLGFELVHSHYVGFALPLRWATWDKAERAYGRYFRHLGAINVILARKKTVQRIPMDMVWKRHASLVGSFSSFTRISRSSRSIN